MCVPGMYGSQKHDHAKHMARLQGANPAPTSMGYKLDQAQNASTSTAAGGTFQGKTVLAGVPRNAGVDAVRKTTTLGV
jgi:hypothetical protein